MARRGAAGRRRAGRRTLWVTLLSCLSIVAVVQPSSSLPQRPRDLFFDETAPDGEVVTATRGSDVVLDCQAIGTPIPTIHWLHRGRRVMQVGSSGCDNYRKLPKSNEKYRKLNYRKLTLTLTGFIRFRVRGLWFRVRVRVSFR